MKRILIAAAVVAIAAGAWWYTRPSESERLELELMKCWDIARDRGNDAASLQACEDIEQAMIAAQAREWSR